MRWQANQIEFSGDLINPEIKAGIVQEENSRYFSVIFEDSVNQFFNVLHLDVRDPRTTIREALLHVNGTHINASLFRENVVPEAKEMYSLKGEFTNLGSAYSVGEQLSDVSDEIAMTLANSFLDKQVVRSKAYKGRISEVVGQIMTNAGWDKKDLDIDECSNEDVWYQMGLTDAEFIKKVLAVNAVAHDSDATPFAAFITSDGVFHFKNLGKLWASPSVKTTATFSMITKETSSGTLIGGSVGEKSVSEGAREDIAKGRDNPLYAVKMWKKIPSSFLDQQRMSIHREVRLDLADGSLVHEQLSALSFPSNAKTVFKRDVRTTRMLPPENQDAFSQSLNFLNNSRGGKTKQAEIENFLGQRISRMWEYMHGERYLALMSEYCPHVKAGTFVAIGVNTTLTKSQKSATHTDLYFVEKSKHGWNRQSQAGESILTLVRWGVGEH
jgi:hypothetical protein